MNVISTYQRMGIVRHADPGYDPAKAAAEKRSLQRPLG